MRNTFILALVLLISATSFGQKKAPKSQTAVILTTAECNDCKERIEGMLNYTKGVKFGELDVPSRKVTVKFSPSVITLDEIKKKISELGYDADDVKANHDAYEKLPSCCKIGGHEH